MPLGFYNISTVLDYAPLRPIKKHFQENWADYATIGSALVTAYFVHAYWGKIATVAFAFAVSSSFSLVSKQLETLVHFDLNTFAQASLATAIAGLCLVNPPIAAGLAASLAMGILKREWTLSSIAKENAKAIDTLREQNAALSKIYQEIKEESERLEQELNLCLNIPTQVKQLVQGQKEASALIQEAEQATDDKLARLKKKMQKVASLCQYAITQKHLLERIKAAGQVEQDLTHLTLECSSRRQELVVLNRDIRDLKDKLQKVLSSLSEQDERIRARLQEVNLRLLGDVTLNNPNLQMETK